MRFLMKFGGTSVADAGSILRVVDIIGKYRAEGHEVAVVVSAQRGVTDQLIAVANEPAKSCDNTAISPFIQSLRDRHLKALEGAAPHLLKETGTVIAQHLDSLENILNAIHNLHELTPRSKDYIISFGERLNAPVVAAALEEGGMKAVVLDGCEAGILTTPHHGEAMALPSSDARIKGRVVPLLNEYVPVIMGFMGCTRKGSLLRLAGAGLIIPEQLSGQALMPTRSGSGRM